MTRAKQLLAALLSIVLVTSVGIVVTGGFAGAQTQQGSASVTIEDQPSDGQTVIVDSVTLPEGGFVVIHDAESLEEGEVVDSVIGVSTYLEAGTHEDVPVTMGQELDTAEVDVVAMAHMDTNGNEVYDFVTSEGELDGAYTSGGAAATETPGVTETETEMTATETPAMGTETETVASSFQQETTTVATETETEAETETETETTEVETETETPEEDEGGPVVDSATIDAVGDGAPATNLEISDQSSDGTTVTVDRVTLYRGGYVVIHDSEELEEGDAVGSVIGHSAYMPPGTYEDVEITLAQPVEFEEGESVNVTAMPHFETNGNLVYDFGISLGSEDGPYTENDSAVTATANLSEGGAGATETEAAGTETPAMGTETETPMGTATETEMAGTETTTEA